MVQAFPLDGGDQELYQVFCNQKLVEDVLDLDGCEHKVKKVFAF